MLNKKINVSTVIIGVLTYKLVKGYFVKSEMRFYKEERVNKVKNAVNKVKSTVNNYIHKDIEGVSETKEEA